MAEQEEQSQPNIPTNGDGEVRCKYTAPASPTSHIVLCARRMHRAQLCHSGLLTLSTSDWCTWFTCWSW